MSSIDSQVEIIDKMLKMYPQLARDRNLIMNNIFGQSTNEPKPYNEVYRFKYGDEVLYRDAYGSIWNANAVIVGAYRYANGDYIYCFFKNKPFDKNIHDKYLSIIEKYNAVFKNN